MLEIQRPLHDVAANTARFTCLMFHSISHQDEPYIDFYDVICDGGNITDCKSIMGDLKRRFKELTLNR